jgi:hypothetical protein
MNSPFHRASVPSYFSYIRELRPAFFLCSWGECRTRHCAAASPLEAPDEVRQSHDLDKKLPGTGKTKEEVVTVPGEVMQATET